MLAQEQDLARGKLSLLTLALQRRPQVDQLVAGLVGAGEVAWVPGGCADRWDSAPGEQEAGWWGLLGLQLCRDGSLSIRFHQALNVARVPAQI